MLDTGFLGYYIRRFLISWTKDFFLNIYMSMKFLDFIIIKANSLAEGVNYD